MKVTTTNIKDITPYPREQKLLEADLADIAEINEKLSAVGKELYIYWENQHTEYSCERTDPCPDYYGWYSIRNAEDNELIGLVEMEIREFLKKNQLSEKVNTPT